MRETADGVVNTIQNNLDQAEYVMDRISYELELLYFLDDQNQISERERDLFLNEVTQEWTNIQYVYPQLFSNLTIYSSNASIVGESAWKFEILSMEAAEDCTADITWNGNLGYGAVKVLGNGDSDAETEVRTETSSVLPLYLSVNNVNTDEQIGIVELDMPLDQICAFRQIRRADELESAIVDSDGILRLLTDSSLQQDLNDQMTAVGQSIQTVLLQEEQYRILAQSEERSGLNAVVMVRQNDVVASARNMIWKVGLVAAAALTAVMIGIYFLVHRTLARLLEMDTAMKQIEEGNFSIDIENDGYGDEISRFKDRFHLMTKRLDEVVQEKVEAENAKKDAEFHALQAQINPHFLYNTLETIRMQSEIDRNYKVSRGLTALAGVLRYALRWDSDTVLVRDEWKHLNQYISIMAMRLDDEFSSHLECDESIMDVEVPKMLLQPVVENSFLHGFKTVPSPWHLEVIGEHLKEGDQDYVRFLITDNGGGVEEERLKVLQKALKERTPLKKTDQRYESIGVINVLKRMDVLCESGSTMTIDNRPEGGIRIELKIRYTEGEKHA